MNPGVGNGRNLEIGRFRLRIVTLDEGADHHGDFAIFHQVDEPVGDRARRADPPGLGHRGQGIDHHATGLMVADQRAQLDQMLFRAARFGPAGIHPQQAGLDVRVEIDAHRRQIARDLLGAFVEAHKQGALAALAGDLGKLADQRGLGGAWRSGDQRAAAPEQTAPQHDIETLEAGGHPFGRGLVNDFGRFGGGHFDAGASEAERKLTRRKIRTAIFGDLEPVRRDSVLQAPVEADHAIHHELHEAVVHYLGGLAIRLGRDDGGQLVVHQPVPEPIDFPHFQKRLPQQPQQYINAVKHDPTGVHLFFLGLEDGQDAAQVELARLDDGGRQMRVEDIDLVFHQRGQTPIEGGGVRHNLAASLLKGDENPRFGALARRVDQGLQREDGFARSRTAHHQRRAVPGQPAAAQLVKPLNAGSHLG